jgi:hypothetical protein
MQIQSGSFSDTAATRQRTEAAGVVNRPSVTSPDLTLSTLTEPLSAEEQKAQDEMWEANRKLNEAYFAQVEVQFMDKLQGEIDRVGQTEPVPPTELSSEEADTVRKLLEAEGRGVSFGEDGVFMALLDNKMYTFTRDGKATVHENGVPTSEDEKQSWLSSLQHDLDKHREATGWLSNEQINQNVKDAQEAADRAFEKLKRFAVSGESGMIYDEKI